MLAGFRAMPPRLILCLLTLRFSCWLSAQHAAVCMGLLLSGTAAWLLFLQVGHAWRTWLEVWVLQNSCLQNSGGKLCKVLNSFLELTKRCFFSLQAACKHLSGQDGCFLAPTGSALGPFLWHIAAAFPVRQKMVTSIAFPVRKKMVTSIAKDYKNRQSQICRQVCKRLNLVLCCWLALSNTTYPSTHKNVCKCKRFHSL